MLLIVAIVGTTVAPWQLFFQQSNIIDKRITPRWIPYERADTVIGSVVVIVGAGALMVAAAFAFKGTSFAGHFTDAGGVAAGFRGTVGGVAGAIFAIVLLNASIIGASAVTLATSYACGDVFRIKHSLHRGVSDAKLFYAVFAGLVALAAGVVLIPGAPLGVITTAVQALAGVLLPSATVFLLLLCNDKDVLGPWINAPWLNGLASVIVAVLLMLSGILVVNTLFPAFDIILLLPWLGAALGAMVVGVVGGCAVQPRRKCRARGAAESFDMANAATHPARSSGLVPRAACGDVCAARLPGDRCVAAHRQGRGTRARALNAVRCAVQADVPVKTKRS